MISKKKIAILGSTGSIGKTVLKIISNDIKSFQILLLTANKNYKELLRQTEKFNVKNVIIVDKESYLKFKKYNKNPNLNIYNDFQKLNKILKKKVDYTMSAIVGIDGLIPTIKIIKFTNNIAIANKESIICGWNLIKNQIKKFKTHLIPVDSEHFSIWYALRNKDNANISKVFLTASGGPLLNFSKKKIKKIKIKEVLNHPNWKMGNKISIDSSTMMNKVFEIIEAKNIFEISLKKLSILIHPKSYIHAIIKFDDGMTKIIAHDTTMEIPIFNSLYESNDKKFLSKKIDLKKLNNLNLTKVNLKKFPLVKLLKYIPEKISLFDTVIVSANDELVRLYLNGKINYNDITIELLKIVNHKEFTKFKKKIPNRILDIINLDRYVRLKINSKGV